MKNIIFLVVILCGVGLTKAQDFRGFANSNYAGISGVYVQPASIVDSRYIVDVNLFGINLGLQNNFFGFKKDAFTATAQNDSNYINKYIEVKDNGKPKSLTLNASLVLPSFMITLNRKSAIGLSIRSRTYFNMDGVGNELAQTLYKQLDYPNIFGVEVSNKNLSFTFNSWFEYGITYGRVLVDKGHHFIKAAVTPKLLQGAVAGYIYVDDLQFKLTNDSTIGILKSQIRFAGSDNTKGFDPSNPFSAAFSFDNLGFGADAGLVYEWRPNNEKHKYKTDKLEEVYRRDVNKYKLKLGVSILDLGKIRYKKNPKTGDFKADITALDVKDLNITNPDDVINELSKQFVIYDSRDYFYMNLPTAFSLQADYKIWKGLYINAMPYIALRRKTAAEKSFDVTNLSITPRWEGKWLGAYLPFSMSTYGNNELGAAVRLGPLVIGTNNLAVIFNYGARYSADFYALLKVPIPYGKPRKVAPPDRDNDSIADNVDACPDVYGIRSLAGCPDKDGDKVADKDDKCPDVAGMVYLEGCPDMDGDSITDLVDACPSLKGIKELKGCPDKDGDKVADKDDKCPDTYGPINLRGCPDKDNDGVLDKDDDCPDVAGLLEKKGCPNKDSDNDGVLDENDDCPNVAGTIPNKGCPEIKKEEQIILEKAFSSLEFAVGKDVIKSTSFKSLTDLAGLLKANPSWVLKMSGHTDNQGDAEKNMELSEKRVKAVKKYLVLKGVDETKVTTEWFGGTQPIADNKTNEGRQKNRRVEMKVLFK